VTLRDVSVRQQEFPDPPILQVPRLKASVQWRELFSGKLVADFYVQRPSLYVNLAQLRHESQDETPMKDKGWQQALRDDRSLALGLNTHAGQLTNGPVGDAVGIESVGLDTVLA
jgi:hypothetical protein